MIFIQAIIIITHITISKKVLIMKQLTNILKSKRKSLISAILALAFALPSFSLPTLKELWNKVMGRTPAEAAIVKCPDPVDVAESLRILKRDRGGRSLTGVGVNIKGGDFVVEDIVGVLHFPINAKDPKFWDTMKLDGSFKKQILEQTRAEADRGRKVCGYVQIAEMGGGAPDDVTLVYLTYKK